jgi:AcrR family transcriptional regulator
MDGVAREAGVSKALVHYYFATRHALLRAAFQHSEDRANARIEAELALARNPAERLERYVVLDFDDEDVFSENRALWSEVWSGMRLDPQLRPDVDRAYRSWVARLVELLEACSVSRSPGLDARAAAIRLAALVDGLDSLLVLDLITQEEARGIVRGAVADELARASSASGQTERARRRPTRTG